MLRGAALAVLLLLLGGEAAAQRLSPATMVTSLTAGNGNVTISSPSGAVIVTPSLTPSVTSMTVGGGTPITGIAVYAPTLTPTQIAAAIGAVEQTFTVTGITTSDKIFVSAPAGLTALCPLVGFRVSATNQIALTFTNLAIALCTPTSGAYAILAVRS